MARRQLVAVAVTGLLQDPAFHVAKCTAEVSSREGKK